MAIKDSKHSIVSPFSKYLSIANGIKEVTIERIKYTRNRTINLYQFLKNLTKKVLSEFRLRLFFIVLALIFYFVVGITSQIHKDCLH